METAEQNNDFGQQLLLADNGGEGEHTNSTGGSTSTTATAIAIASGSNSYHWKATESTAIDWVEPLKNQIPNMLH